MNRTNTGKRFDCMELKRKVQREISRETRGMTPQQEIEYFNRTAETGRLGKWWKKIRKPHGA